MVSEREEQGQSQEEEAAVPAEAVEPPAAGAEPAVVSEPPPEPVAEASGTAAKPPGSTETPDEPATEAATETAAPRPVRSADAGRGRRRGRYPSRRKVCQFCVEHVDVIDYKDVSRLRRFLSDRGRIEPRRKLGTCAKHQRALSVALKRARHLALLPYTAEHIRQSGAGLSRQ